MLDKVSQQKNGLSTEVWQMEIEVKPSRNGQIQFSSKFMAKLSLTSRKAKFGLIQLFQLAFGFVGRGAAALLVLFTKTEGKCSKG